MATVYDKPWPEQLMSVLVKTDLASGFWLQASGFWSQGSGFRVLAVCNAEVPGGSTLFLIAFPRATGEGFSTNSLEACWLVVSASASPLSVRGLLRGTAPPAVPSLLAALAAVVMAKLTCGNTKQPSISQKFISYALSFTVIYFYLLYYVVLSIWYYCDPEISLHQCPHNIIFSAESP